MTTETEFITRIGQEVKSLDNYLESEDYTNASENAQAETGFSFPNTDTFQLLWLRKRAIRHLFYFLLSQSAHQFKFEQLNLQHRFDHYKDLVAQADKDWMDVQEERPDKFANVNPCALFGTVIGSGFRYEEQSGVDLTYDSDNLVPFAPKAGD